MMEGERSASRHPAHAVEFGDLGGERLVRPAAVDHAPARRTSE